MGRQRQPIDNDGPIGQFAATLRQRIDQVPNATFRDMAHQTNWAASTLCEAVGGRKLPSWPKVRDILRYCGASEGEIRGWAGQWRNAKQQLTNQPADPIQPRLSSRAGDWRPQPDRVQTFEDLALELRRFKIAAGNPTLKVLVQHLDSPALAAPCSITGLSNVFTGKRHPTSDLYRSLVHALSMMADRRFLPAEKDHQWRSFFAWTEAWTRAEFHRQSSGGR